MVAPDQSALGFLRGLPPRQPPAPNISTAHLSLSTSFHLCLRFIFGPRVGLSILFDLFLCVFCFFSGILFSIGVPPPRRCSSSSTLQQLEAGSTITNHVPFLWTLV